MNTRLFHEHEPDSLIKFEKDSLEIASFAESLEYIKNTELDYLLEIEDRMLNDSYLYSQLHAIRCKSTVQLSTLYRYETMKRKTKECDTMACDTYCLNHHEKYRNLYLEHLRNYRLLKSKVLSKIR